MASMTLLVACGDDKTRYGDDDFVWGFGVDGPETLRFALLDFHMAEDDADCAVATIFTPDFEPDPAFGHEYAVTAEQLEVAIDACDIDTSRIWRSWD